MVMVRALVANGDSAEQEGWAEALRGLGAQVKLAASADAALKVLSEEPIDLFLAGDRLIVAGDRRLRSPFSGDGQGIKVVVVAEPGANLRNFRLGEANTCTIISRPIQTAEIRSVMERMIGRRELGFGNRMQGERSDLRQGLGGLAGTSAKMQKVYDLIAKVAPHRHPVLVLGESGTGKELVARAIHSTSPWNQEPFVPIDCGALSSQLIESELFGNVRGAFTGASQSRTGLLAAAGRGTVFLDEIGELPVELQARLLRALQEREVRPVGSNRRFPVEARIIAGTNQHLEGAVTRGTFRKDLFFRLNVVPIKLPPLRERKSDIPALVACFIERFAGISGGVAAVSPEALSRLLNYEWPGNVRELENCIQRAMALGSGPEIQVQDLPSNLLYGITAGPERRSFATLQEIERRAIAEALEFTGGDRLRAAKLLGIGKTTNYRKIKEYGLERVSALASP